MTTPEVQAAIRSVFSESPSKALETLTNLMNQRAGMALQFARESIASSLFTDQK